MAIANFISKCDVRLLQKNVPLALHISRILLVPVTSQGRLDPVFLWIFMRFTCRIVLQNQLVLLYNNFAFVGIGYRQSCHTKYILYLKRELLYSRLSEFQIVESEANPLAYFFLCPALTIMMSTPKTC